MGSHGLALNTLKSVPSLSKLDLTHDLSMAQLYQVGTICSLKANMHTKVKYEKVINALFSFFMLSFIQEIKAILNAIYN